MSEAGHLNYSSTPSISQDVDSVARSPLASLESSKPSTPAPAWKANGTELARLGEWNRSGRKHGDDDDSSCSGGGSSSTSKDYKDNDSPISRDCDPLIGRPSTDDAIDEDEAPPPPPTVEKEKPVSWSELPKKSQLAILTLARLSEPLAQTSLQSYMFYQLKSFKLPDGSSPSDDTVARQAGILAAAFTGAQFMTAILWGRLADWERMGRKRVILIGLLGTAVGSLGFGFSQSFVVAVFWRCVAGLLNGNIGVMRTMISEMIREKKYQSRAFLLLPMTFNIGVIIGPLIGGWLADPVGSHPDVFGPGGSLGGRDGVRWMMVFPYALPNVVNCVFLTVSAIALALGLEETHGALRGKADYGLRLTRWFARAVLRIKPKQEYLTVAEQLDGEGDIESVPTNKDEALIGRKLPFRRMFTANVVATLISHGLLAMHVGTFNSLWFVFLSTPRYDPEGTAHSTRSPQSSTEHTEPVRVPENYHPHLPFTFTGGLAFPPSSIGTALAILGIIGVTLQLLLYPPLSFRLGTIRSLRYALLLFPLSYFLAPYLAVLPSIRPAPDQASGFFIWFGISVVLYIQVTARTFALPASAILVNNSSPHPSVLGSLHGVAQSVSSATRTIGPVVGGVLYGVGLNKGIVGLAWFCMSGVAVLGAFASLFVREGDGHEIKLEDESEEQ